MRFEIPNELLQTTKQQHNLKCITLHHVKENIKIE